MLATIDKALARCERNGERWYLAELLRIRGEILSHGAGPDAPQKAEQCFKDALDWSHRQGTAAWQLRAASSLAKLYRAERRETEAQSTWSRVYESFTEGFDTADLREAKASLAVISATWFQAPIRQGGEINNDSL